MNLKLKRNHEINELAATRDSQALRKAADLCAHADYDEDDFQDHNDAYIDGHACGITAALRLVNKLQRLRFQLSVGQSRVPKDLGIYLVDLPDTDEMLYFVGTKEQIITKIARKKKKLDLPVPLPIDQEAIRRRLNLLRMS
jgi:hypothetical protein